MPLRTVAARVEHVAIYPWRPPHVSSHDGGRRGVVHSDAISVGTPMAMWGSASGFIQARTASRSVRSAKRASAGLLLLGPTPKWPGRLVCRKNRAMTGIRALREVLRELPVLTAVPPPFDLDQVPADPTALFVEWLDGAIEMGVAEPHAMTLSTIDADGAPDARVLILKDVDHRGLWFATSAASRKGRQLEPRPVAAVTFYWPALGRSVRVRGRVTAASPERSAADFRARGLGARAVALATQESRPLASLDECAAAVTTARTVLATDPALVSPEWTLYVVTPEEVEFWQADADRQHTRLCYTRDTDAGWQHGLLWP
jgi:pyridoxamine 5'-phosphate oxidase